MSPVFIWWLDFAIFDAGMLIFYVHWYLRHPEPNDPTVVTLWDFICAGAAVLCPAVNILVAICISVWFATEVAPRIVLFGSIKK
jgi:hypothetical protein